MPASKTVNVLRGRRANALLRNDQAAAALHARDLRAELLAEHAARVAAAAPPLSDEQVDRISAILNRGGRK